MSSVIQRAFVGGEIAPQLYARCDEIKYQTGLRTMRNFLIMRNGGAANRPGTNYITQTKTLGDRVRLIPFEVSTEVNYVLEFGDGYFRIIKDDQYVIDFTETITGVTSFAGETELTLSSNDLIGAQVIVNNVGGMWQLNGRIFETYDETMTTFKIRNLDGTNVDSSGYDAYTSGGGASNITEFGSPYAIADLPFVKYVQSIDVMQFAMNSYVSQTLKRMSDADWDMGATTIGTTFASPPITSITGPVSTPINEYEVSAISQVTSEESLPGTPLAALGDAVGTSPTTINFTGVTGAVLYNVYKKTDSGSNNSYGFIGSATASPFIDNGATPDLTQPPQKFRDPFLTSIGGAPGCVAYIQQRLTYGNLVNFPERVEMSQTGKYLNFNTSIPVIDSDSVEFDMVGSQINPVKHIIDLGAMVILTEKGEWLVNGGQSGAGAITPSNINLQQQSAYGCNDVRPIVIGQTALFVQARGNILRDLSFQWQSQGYVGNDLTVFSPHLFENHQIVEMCYQQIPNSIVWAVRDDGVLLGLTYIKEQQIWGWHRHDFNNDFQNGFVESICAIPDPDGQEDAVYVSIRRTINGNVVRYVEKITTRTLDNVVDFIGMDAAISYDGTNTTGTTFALSTTTDGWTSEDLIEVTASAATFNAEMVGEGLQFTPPGSTVAIRFNITAYVDSTHVKGFPSGPDIPASIQTGTFTTWALAIKTLRGLWHLEGQTVAVFADGYVVESPNNSHFDTPLVVTGGEVILPTPYAIIHVGLSYVSDIETLDIDTASDPAIRLYNKRINQVAANVFQSRGFFAGTEFPEEDPQNIGQTNIDALQNLLESKVRNFENYEQPIELHNDVVKVNITTSFNRNGRIAIRNVDPIPLALLSIIPSGDIPFGGGGKQT